MSFNTILKRASSFLGFSGNDHNEPQCADGDIVYCKNNVCVHTPSQYRGEGSGIHHPGYMVIKCHSVPTDNKSLTLTWIPNERLKRNHELIHSEISIENSWSSQNVPEIDSLSLASVPIPELRFSTLKKEEEDEYNGEKIEGSDDTTSLPSVGRTNESSTEFGTSSNSSSSFAVTAGNEDSTNNVDLEQGSRMRKTRRSSNEGSSTSGVYSSDGISELSFTEHTTQKKVIEEEKEENSEVLTKDSSSAEYQETAGPSVNQYVSTSSDSSLENDKPRTGASVAAETSEGSFQVEPNSDDEISVGSSTDLQNSPPPRYFSSRARDQWYDRSAESMAYSANLAFPESPSAASSMCPTPIEGGSSPIRRAHKCSIFSVDLGHMKSLRLFFSDKEQTCGQLVIASQESQYKILHFHHGGLDKLASVFEDWNFLLGPQKKERCRDPEVQSDPSLKQFSVCRPEIQDIELHPEEGSYEYLDAELWLTYFTEDGMIEDDLALRRTIFFGGVEPQLRTSVWPFLLHYYDFRTTFDQRQAKMEEKHQLYAKISEARANITGEEKEHFWKDVQCTVEKDVVRTDRSKRCFAGIDNPNLEKMKNILLNFAYYNPEIGYTQGMSDIVAPILSEVRNEADVYWCFTGMMSKTIFVTSPRDRDMEKNLRYLCELLRIMNPTFYEYVANQEDGMDLLFCHRWILLCFKREFNEDEILAMWEACWSNYQTDYFHLFLVVAIITIYGREVTDQEMRPDEMLLYFTSLANHMDGSLVLKKARGLLHQFRSKERIPCSLVGLCELCGPGMWDSGHAPTVVCKGHHDGSDPCLLSQSSVSLSKEASHSFKGDSI